MTSSDNLLQFPTFAAGNDEFRIDFLPRLDELWITVLDSLRKLKAAVPTSTWLKWAINTSFDVVNFYVSRRWQFRASFYWRDLAQVVNHDPAHLPSPLSPTSSSDTTCPRNCRNWKTLTRGVFTQPKCYSAEIKSIRAFKVNELHHSSSRPLHNVLLPVFSRFSFIFFMPILDGYAIFTYSPRWAMLHKTFLIKDVLAFVAR